jgi:50S ribosomal protein L16 3-hydroxylase
MPHRTMSRLLGGLTPRVFLRRHWQKEPLVVRGALPGFRGTVGLGTLAALASRHDVESRFITRRGRDWRVAHGPIARERIEAAPARNWTLLVNGVNLHARQADELLRRFSFIPQARLDDVMVSYSAPGGGVGAHADSYDVFLVQGRGRRLWRLCAPREFAFVAGAPLRLIENFSAEEELLLEPGDLLYLPPGWGHEGTALEPSLTCSVGFRAPGGEELAAGFLDWLHVRGLPAARYGDPDLRPVRHPARVPTAMGTHANALLARLRWKPSDVACYLGEQLSAPKPHVVFAGRPRASRKEFDRALDHTIVSLDLRSQLLYDRRRFYLNGEAFSAAPAQRRALAELADQRNVAGRKLARAGLAGLSFEWYRLGYVGLAGLRSTARKHERGQ